MISIFKKYHDRTLQYGVYDCNLMVLEYIGFDVSSLPEYSSIEEGTKILSEALGASNSSEVLHSYGWSEIDPLLAFDGDILIQGIHSFIYFDGMLFGVDKHTHTFQYLKLPLTALMQLKAYRNNNKNKVE